MRNITDLPVRRPSPPPRRLHTGSLDPVSEAWARTYRRLSAVRPNCSGHALAAEVEAVLAGVTA